MRPIDKFHENFRPAELMLDVYRLLNTDDNIQRDGEFVERVRKFLEATEGEDLIVIQNELFLGIVREKASLASSRLKSLTLRHLLRQAVVVSCTALETFLLNVLQAHLPTVIRLRQREFFPQDKDLRDYFDDLKFSLEDALRVMTEEDAPLFLSNKILGLVKHKYMSGRKGVHSAGALLSLEKPWDAIAAHLKRDKKELMRIIEETVQRRNDIVHRADYLAEDTEPQPITESQARQGADSIHHVCLALDELLIARLKELSKQMPVVATGEA
jgi:hypothetical protein